MIGLVDDPGCVPAATSGPVLCCLSQAPAGAGCAMIAT